MSHLPSNAAVVMCSNPRFEDIDGNEDQDQVSMTITIKYNGHAPEQGDVVTFARNATLANKQAAVRARVNAPLAPYEPSVTLNNANIQISGLPV